jgi:hypothetical protein
MLPVLRRAGDRQEQEHSLAEIRQSIASEPKLSQEELTERLASDSTTVFSSRVAWAVQYLKQAGVLEIVKRFPESKQAFGTRAKQFTAGLVFGKTVIVHVRAIDRYKRQIAEVILPDGRNLNREIVKAGFAWRFVAMTAN